MKFDEMWKTPEESRQFVNKVNVFWTAFLAFALFVPLAIGGNLTDYLINQTNLLIYIFISIIIYVWGRTEGSKASYFGSGSYDKAVIGIILGAVITVVLFTNLSPQSGLISVALSGLTENSYLTIILSGIIVWYHEEKLFGGIIPTILQRQMKNIYGVIIITAILFAGFHYFAYHADFHMMLMAGLFRVFVLIGNFYLKTDAFGLSAHAVHNMVWIGRQLMRVVG